MTKEQAQKFFNEVKNKKIFRSDWRKNKEFFIPESVLIDNHPIIFKGITFCDGRKFKDTWSIYNGFKPDNARLKWILLEPKSHLPSFL